MTTPISTVRRSPSGIPGLTERVMGLIRPLIKGYFRSEVRGLENFPPGGALVVSNHSGGMFPMDVPVFAVDFYDKFGYDRPVYTLSHDMLFIGPTARLLPQDRLHPRQPRERRRGAALRRRRGGVPRRRLRRLPAHAVGEHDRLRRPQGLRQAAINAGVPIVPAVSIGGQESQLYLSRGTGWPSGCG